MVVVDNSSCPSSCCSAFVAAANERLSMRRLLTSAVACRVLILVLNTHFDNMVLHSSSLCFNGVEVSTSPNADDGALHHNGSALPSHDTGNAAVLRAVCDDTSAVSVLVSRLPPGRCGTTTTSSAPSASPTVVLVPIIIPTPEETFPRGDPLVARTNTERLQRLTAAAQRLYRSPQAPPPNCSSQEGFGRSK